MIRSLFVLATFGVLCAGCSGVKIIDSEPTTIYYDGAFEYATQGGTIKTAVVGSPFPRNETGKFTETVTDTMRNAPFGRDVEFVPAPRNKDKNAFHVVVVFNGVHPFTEQEVCENDVPITSKALAGTTTMFAVFCQGAFPLSFSSGSVEKVNGPNDENFIKLVREVTQAMIPRYDDFHSSGFTPF